jgi:hypothetical protein
MQALKGLFQQPANDHKNEIPACAGMSGDQNLNRREFG